MGGLNPMRLSPKQITQIRQSAAESFGPEARVWLFGSRVADGQKARQTLGWQPRFENLGTIVDHACRWGKGIVDQRLVLPHVTRDSIPA